MKPEYDSAEFGGVSCITGLSPILQTVVVIVC